jgi:hypothetical protein
MATAKKKATPKKTKGSKTPKAEFGAKTKFVRTVALDMPAKQVVEEAAKQGLAMSENHVYAVRAEMRKKKKQRPTARTPKSSGAVPRVPAPSAKSTGLEAQLRHAIAELGLARARAIFAEVEKAFAG